MFRSSVATIVFGLLLFGSSAGESAFAQTRALPTAPGADRATQGGAAMAPASLPKVRGASPLEPYLITLLLPISGLVIFAFCVGMDRRLRAHGHV